MPKTCRICKKPIEKDGEKWFPFCSERCKLIDLGQWASEEYRIPDRKLGENELEGIEESKSQIPQPKE